MPPSIETGRPSTRRTRGLKKEKTKQHQNQAIFFLRVISNTQRTRLFRIFFSNFIAGKVILHKCCFIEQSVHVRIPPLPCDYLPQPEVLQSVSQVVSPGAQGNAPVNLAQSAEILVWAAFGWADREESKADVWAAFGWADRDRSCRDVWAELGKACNWGLPETRIRRERGIRI